MNEVAVCEWVVCDNFEAVTREPLLGAFRCSINSKVKEWRTGFLCLSCIAHLHAIKKESIISRRPSPAFHVFSRLFG